MANLSGTMKAGAMSDSDREIPTRYMLVFLVVIALALAVGIIYDTQPRFMKVKYVNCYNPENDPCAMNGTCPPLNLSLNFSETVWVNGSYCEVEWQ